MPSSWFLMSAYVSLSPCVFNFLVSVHFPAFRKSFFLLFVVCFITTMSYPCYPAASSSTFSFSFWGPALNNSLFNPFDAIKTSPLGSLCPELVSFISSEARWMGHQTEGVHCHPLWKIRALCALDWPTTFRGKMQPPWPSAAPQLTRLKEEWDDVSPTSWLCL